MDIIDTRPTTARLDVPVLVVGAGPAGLVTAIGLARHGVRSLVIERHASTSIFPRATGVSLRSMEIFRGWGIDADIRRGSWRVKPVGADVTTLDDPAPVEYPLGFSDTASAAVSPETAAVSPQDHIEPVLVEHYRSLGLGEIRFSTELVAFDQDAEGVTATIRDRVSGEMATVRSHYLVGADGHRSTVRGLAGIAMDGPDDLGQYLSILFRADLDDVLGETRYGLYTLPGPAGPEGPPRVVVPSGGDDRYVLGIPLPPGMPPQAIDAAFPPERCIELVREATGRHDLPVEIAGDQRVRVLGPGRGADARRPRLPRRGCGPPDDAARRPGHEHRHRRRLRPRLEARLGQSGDRRLVAARLVRVRARPDRPAQRRAVDGAGRWLRRRPGGGRVRGRRRTGRASTACLAGDREGTPVDARPVRSGARASRRRRRIAVAGCRERACRRTTAACRSASGPSVGRCAMPMGRSRGRTASMMAALSSFDPTAWSSGGRAARPPITAGPLPPRSRSRPVVAASRIGMSSPPERSSGRRAPSRRVAAGRRRIGGGGMKPVSRWSSLWAALAHLSMGWVIPMSPPIVLPPPSARVATERAAAREAAAREAAAREAHVRVAQPAGNATTKRELA